MFPNAEKLLKDCSFVESEKGGLYIKPKISQKQVVIRDAAGKILYACMGIMAGFQFVGPVYCSADNDFEAAQQFQAFHREKRFVEIHAGPAIGFFVHDNHGDKLSGNGIQKTGA